MIDSNNINVMREKLRKLKALEDISVTVAELNHLIGGSRIPTTATTITGCLNKLDERITALEEQLSN